MFTQARNIVHNLHCCEDLLKILNKAVVHRVKDTSNHVRHFKSSASLLGEICPRKEVTATSSVYTDKMCMPAIILGTWKIDSLCQAEEALTAALKVGYRAIDTATHYGNEKVLGLALKTALDVTKLTRDDVFLITKLPFNGMRAKKVKEYLCRSLKALRTDFVDLYMINFPAGSNKDESGKYVPDLKVDHASLWKAMEEMVDKGKTKYIGVCNFNSRQLKDLLACAKIMPSNVQVEINPYFQDEDYRKLAKDLKITVTGYAPLGRPSDIEDWMKDCGIDSNKVNPLNDASVSSVARKLEKNNSQVILRYLLQLDDNLSVVMGGTDPKVICNNFDIFNFCVDNKDFCKLKALDKGSRGKLYDRDVFKLLFPGVETSPHYPWPNS